MNTNKLAGDILRRTIMDGGCTLYVYADGTTMDVHEGIAVGGRVPSFIIAPNADRLSAAKQLAHWLKHQPYRGCIGGWRDYDGTIYIDVIDLISNRTQALQLGKQRNELAVYDLAAAEELRIA